MRTLSPARTCSRRFAILAPKESGVPAYFSQVSEDQGRYHKLLADVQRMRGRIYLSDGAITPSDLTVDGRHEMRGDLRSWHLLLLDQSENVVGCMRFLLHQNTVSLSSLNTTSSAIAQCDRWGGHLRKALRAELTRARKENVGFSEIGGWAVDENYRCSAEALKIVLATYSLGQLLGDALGVSTATTRNGSAKILRRLGGQSVVSDGVELPPYFDPYYRCDMELLRFDSRAPNPRYSDWVDELHYDVLTAPVIYATAPSALGKIFTFEPAKDLAQRA